jgi:hypothetical protein
LLEIGFGKLPAGVAAAEAAIVARGHTVAMEPVANIEGEALRDALEALATPVVSACKGRHEAVRQRSELGKQGEGFHRNEAFVFVSQIARNSWARFS